MLFIDLQLNRIVNSFHWAKHTYDLELLFECVFSIRSKFMNIRHCTRGNPEPKTNVIILYQQCAEVNMHAECV